MARCESHQDEGRLDLRHVPPSHLCLSSLTPEPNPGEDWIPVFDKHHVDLVLQGHDHAYCAPTPCVKIKRVASNAEGTTYVVAVSGEKFCEQDPRGYTELGLTQVSTYQTIDIDIPENRLIYRAWNLEGQEARSPPDRKAASSCPEIPAQLSHASWLQAIQ